MLQHATLFWRTPAAVATLLALAGLATLGSWVVHSRQAQAQAGGQAGAPAQTSLGRPALTVQVVQPLTGNLALRVPASGSIAAWQEAIIGAETNGARLADVRVNVGDVVKKGQVLATFQPDMLQADLAQIQASVAEAEATLAEASANAQRARELQTTGALSAQQINQYLTAERTAQARLNAQRAAAQVQRLRVAQTQVLAPDAGVISARAATVGAVVPAGQELFRLIRQGRLEWRAELPSAELARIRVGQPVRVQPPGGAELTGRVRMVAPTVDAATRNGLVYVDLPGMGAGIGPAKPGMFARGEFELGTSSALTLPASAVLLREGFQYVFTVGDDQKVRQLKVAVGRRQGERVEITSGLAAGARVVAAGGGFLSDGDLVRVVPTPAAPAASAAR
jgi:RND family efflux transporter MFP subunit